MKNRMGSGGWSEGGGGGWVPLISTISRLCSVFFLVLLGAVFSSSLFVVVLDVR